MSPTRLTSNPHIAAALSLLAAVALMLSAASPAMARLQAEQIPLFKWRARVVSVEGQPSTTDHSFGFFRFPRAESHGGEWTEWTAFDGEHATAATGPHAYPNTYLRSWPLVIKLAITGVKDPTVVEVEAQFDGQDNVKKMSANLFSGTLGFLITQDDAGHAAIATMREHNQKYWDALGNVNIPDAQRPHKFPVVDRFIGGDSDNDAWREGINNLARAGFSGIMLPASVKYREMAEAAGHDRTAWGVYSPPGYAFDYALDDVDGVLKTWADKLAKPYTDAGYEPEAVALMAMSDEPGWYYPQMFDALEKSERGMTRFHQYLKDQGMTLELLGKTSWDDVKPIGRNEDDDLPSKRLFYWTGRFFTWDSSRHFADATRALEAAFYEGMPSYTNWNFFAGRYWVPGPVANNAAKKSDDPAVKNNAAMGGHDWLEFGRMRGSTMLWTEDWFGDQMAAQWSFYAAKLRSAAVKGNVEFGGYVIPRTAGQREDGIVQKIITIAGSGGKGIKYFVFGPEYNFPSNCYSENIKVLPKMAEAHAMIGAAEDLLWPGRRPTPQVAILSPRSSQPWDAQDIDAPTQIYDATNTNLNGRTVDYLAETFNLYTALQYANIPTDFVEDIDLSPAGLKNYKVVYLTEPNVPEEYVAGVIEWVKQGGVLALTSGAAQADRYDQPSTLMNELSQIAEQPRGRMLVANLNSFEASEKIAAAGAYDETIVFGPTTRPIAAEGSSSDVLATFADASPAIVMTSLGKGKVIRYGYLPGSSFRRSSAGQADLLAVDFSPVLHQLATLPVSQAGVHLPVTVSETLVETPLLLSDAGAVVTILNWTGKDIGELVVEADLPFTPTRVESVKHGDLQFTAKGKRVRVTLPAGAADFVMYHAK